MDSDLPSQATEWRELDDQQLIQLLQWRVAVLERSMKAMARRLEDISALRTYIAFVGSTIVLLIVLGLALAPYLEITRQPIPRIISYIAGFAVVFAAYFVYKAFQRAVA